MRRLLAEAVGTFALVFAGTGACVIDRVTGGRVTHVGVALTFGLIVMAMIYSLGELSGAHFNPAVTVGFWIARRFKARDVPGYVLAQCAGALAASLLLHVMFPGEHSLGATLPAGPALQSLALETVLTAILMFTILSVACGSREQGLMAGIAIGGVVALEALFAGPISGASMNPARSLAPALVSGNLRDLWLYILGPLAGSAIAVLVFTVLHGTGPAAPPPPTNH